MLPVIPAQGVTLGARPTPGCLCTGAALRDTVTWQLLFFAAFTRRGRSGKEPLPLGAAAVCLGAGGVGGFSQVQSCMSAIWVKKEKRQQRGAEGRQTAATPGSYQLETKGKAVRPDSEVRTPIPTAIPLFTTITRAIPSSSE